jgi:hypothetical protein
MYFKWSGKLPEYNDLLHTWVKGELMKEELSNLVDTSSHPEEFLNLKDFIVFNFFSDKDFRLILGNEFLKDCSK